MRPSCGSTPSLYGSGSCAPHGSGSQRRRRACGSPQPAWAPARHRSPASSDLPFDQEVVMSTGARLGILAGIIVVAVLALVIAGGGGDDNKDSASTTTTQSSTTGTSTS